MVLVQIRQTNVREGEAGGITQQIGATYFPVSAIKEKTQVVNKVSLMDLAHCRHEADYTIPILGWQIRLQGSWSADY